VEKISRLPDAVASPCVRNCCLDERDICLGCHRSITEITGWSAADSHQRNEILLRCAMRREQRKHGKTISS
jgi:predicted Fe-S protein YdhL (DUF1289 family)